MRDEGPGDRRWTGAVLGNRFMAWRLVAFALTLLAIPSILSADVIRSQWVLPLRNAHAWLAASSLRAFGVEVRRDGTQLLLPDQILDIVAECTGVDVFLFVSCAMLLFPCSVRAKLAGVLLSFLVTSGINSIRIIVVSVAGPGHVFDVVHSYLFPLAVIAAGMATFLWWAGQLMKSDA